MILFVSTTNSNIFFLFIGDLIMHRTLFLLSIIVLTYSVQAMDFKAIQTIHTKQIGTENAQFKNYAKEQRNQERKERSEAYRHASRLNIMNGNTDATAECFIRYFPETFAQPSLPQAHLNLVRTPPFILNAVLSSNNENKLDNKEKRFYTRLALMPEDIRYEIITNHLFSGNKEAAAVFNSKPYGQSLLAVAYASEKVKNNPIAMFTMDEQLGLAIESPEMHRLFLRINNIHIHKNGELPKLTLYGEQFLATKMPQIVRKHLNKNFKVWCQLPYGERILPALENGLSYGSAVVLICTVCTVACGCFNTAALLNLTEPLTIANYAGYIVGITFSSVGFMVGDSCHILYKMSKSYPVEKTLGDIIRQHNKQ